MTRLRRQYGSEIRRECLEASKAWGRWWALLPLGLHGGIAWAAGALGLAAFRRAFGPDAGGMEPAWPARVALVACYLMLGVVTGSRLRALGNMLHEASHRTLSSSVRVNDALGHLLAALDFQSFVRYRREHLSHHLHLGSAERDLDFQRTRTFGFARRVEAPWRVHVLGALWLKHLPAFLRPVLWCREDPPLVTTLRLLGYAAVGAFLHLSGAWDAFLLAFVVPYVTSYQVFRYWSDAFDHGSLLGEEDAFLRTRNHTLGCRALEAFVFPRNDAFHLTHHLFPSVPTRLLRTLHHTLLQDPVYAARNHGVNRRTFEDSMGSARLSHPSGARVNFT